MFIIITLYFKTFLCQSFYAKSSAYLLSRLLAQNSSKQMRVNKQHYCVLGIFAAKLLRTLSKRMVPCSLLLFHVYVVAGAVLKSDKKNIDFNFLSLRLICYVNTWQRKYFAGY